MDTAALRTAAPRWSLAGDQQLLALLQDIHQRIVSKCNETNRRLEEMAHSLRDASVNLQNVNNKFLALSNSQFVESRVYEDDADVTAPPPVEKEPPQLRDLSSDISKLKRSLQILESYHEPLTILRDSDSDSDSEEEDDRLVLKPKDLYEDRPLPFIIGTAAWKAKWHAGLVDSGSDTESVASRSEQVEQYSESDEEPQRVERPAQGRKISTGSSSLQSEAAVSVSPVRPSPSDVAAEIARRLGGNVKLPEREPYTEPDPVPRKLYKPQQPTTALIFPDEPPPLDEESSEEDIFAELHNPRPKSHGNTVESDLFDFAPKTNDLEKALFGTRNVVEPTSTAKPPLDEVPQPVRKDSISENSEKEENMKKPVGGISLFGTNKHAESIGAAILKRNRRKSSTSGDESNAEDVKDRQTNKQIKNREDRQTDQEIGQTENKEVKKERDIFDDLFAKSEKLNKKNAIKEPIKQKEVKKDAFSDIFDDIDDIFSSDIVNVKIKETKNNEKPLFDDDDDLFAEISTAKVETQKVGNVAKSSLLDDVKAKNEKPVVVNKNNAVKDVRKESKGLFDSDSDDGLFTNAKAKDVPKENVQKSQKPVEYKISDDIFGDEDDDLFTKSKPTIKEFKSVSKATDKTKGLFDSGDELFVNNVKQPETPDKKRNDIKQIDDGKLVATEVKETEKQPIDKGTIVANSEDLFISSEKSEALKVVDNINKDIFNDGDELFKQTEPTKASIETVGDSFGDEDLFVSSKSSINVVHKTELNTEDKLKTIDKNINNDSDDSDELFKVTEPSKVPYIEENVDNGLFENNKSLIINTDQTAALENKDLQCSKNTVVPENNYGIYNQPYEHTNVLRTTRIASDEENVQTDNTKRDIFDDTDDTGLFKTTKIPKPDESSSTQSSNIPSEIFVAKTDIFSDIFEDVPPIFEKPTEPKKSRNVNALFDDDSDDEALFFKKNDVITDEIPDISPTEERFGIFNDEPPAIDVDFAQKSIKNDNPQSFTSMDTKEKIDVEENSSLVSDKIDNITSKPSNIDDVNITKSSIDTTDNTAKDAKKVGKLKPMNFNINVNSLLPGASPKKKQLEDTDTHSASNEELHRTDIEPAMVKSVSFDDPEILDNKISKERAKIQVKRRPSTRRARREAVRKSAIDLTDSSFDSSNDSSVKDNVKEKVVKTVYILNDADIFGDKIETHEPVLETTKKHLNIVDSDEELFKSSNDNETISKDAKNSNQESNDKVKSFLDSDDDDDLFKNKANDVKEEKRDERKKYVYSDHDEDLFKHSSSTVDTNENKPNLVFEDSLFSKTEKKSTENEKHKTKLFNDLDENDDLFTSNIKATTSTKSNYTDDVDLFKNKKGIETLGKAYESKVTSATEKPIHSIFDDFPAKPDETNKEDEKIKPKEVFTEKTAMVQKSVMKKSILDESSDEDDLFKTKTKIPIKKEGQSLFGGDPGEGDDLFGPKPVKEQLPVAAAIQPTKELKSAETVFVDPLSLFEDDE